MGTGSLPLSFPWVALDDQVCVFSQSCSQASFLCVLTSCLHRITLTTLRGMHREPAIGEKLCVNEVHRVLGVPMGQLVDSGEMLPAALGWGS